MNETQATWHAEIAAIITDDSGRLLLCGEDEYWTLPIISVNERVWTQNFEFIRQQFQEFLGVGLDVLRYARFQEDEDRRIGSSVFVLQLKGPLDAKRVSGSWLELDKLATLAFSDAVHGELVRTYAREELENSIPSERVAWARRDWYRDTETWILGELAKEGVAPTGPAAYKRNCGWSCLLECPTDQGAIIFKQADVSTLFANEAKVTMYMAQRFPEHFFMPIATDRLHGSLLMRDHGDRQAETNENLCRVYSEFAAIQKQLVNAHEELLQNGFPDRRLHKTLEDMQILFDEHVVMNYITKDELEKLRHDRPWLREQLHQLQRAAIPETYCHLDLQIGNVRIGEEAVRYFDLVDSCVSHPFFDLFPLQSGTAGRLDHELIEMTYISQWKEYAQLDELQRICRLSKPVAAMFNAISAMSMLSNQEPMHRYDLLGWGRLSMQTLLKELPA